jgi:dTDP-4-dehydrorhamnose reductase
VNGQLGADLRELLMSMRDLYEVVGVDLPDFDVRNHALVIDRLKDIAPSMVVNMAAFHRVDDCENDARLAFEVNAVAVHSLARTCAAFDVPLMHFSTDYVYGGDRTRTTPLAESDPPAPTSVYGASKLAGEHVLRSTWRKHFIVRPSGLYGRNQSEMKGGNFVEIMLRLAAAGKPIKVVGDQRLGPTSTYELARRLEELLRTEAWGLYHLTAGGDCTWFEFAQAIFELADLRPELSPTTTEAYGAQADRPRYSVLDNKAARAIGLTPMIHWREALANYLTMTGRRR